jgi:hypothetical protein
LGQPKLTKPILGAEALGAAEAPSAEAFGAEAMVSISFRQERRSGWSEVEKIRLLRHGEVQKATARDFAGGE